MPDRSSPPPTRRSITEGQLYLLVAAAAVTADVVLWAKGVEITIATALLVGTAAVGVVGWRIQVSEESRRRELREVRGEVRHFAGVVEMMAADMEAADVRTEQAIERAWQQGAAEAAAEGQAERQRLVERHQEELEEVRRKAEARGYVAGARQRLGGEGGRPTRLRVVRQEGRRVPPLPVP